MDYENKNVEVEARGSSSGVNGATVQEEPDLLSQSGQLRDEMDQPVNVDIKQVISTLPRHSGKVELICLFLILILYYLYP